MWLTLSELRAMTTVLQTRVMQESEPSLAKSHDFIHLNRAYVLSELHLIAHSLLHTYILHTRMRKAEKIRIHLTYTQRSQVRKIWPLSKSEGNPPPKKTTRFRFFPITKPSEYKREQKVQLRVCNTRFFCVLYPH